MRADRLIRTARHRAGLSLRELAALAGTSHSTLAAYEQGHKTPNADTLDRILQAAGFNVDVVLTARPARDREARGRELLEVLELAERFPARHDPELRYPVFGKVA